MTDYTKLVDALRCRATRDWTNCGNCKYADEDDDPRGCWGTKICADAADAIEALEKQIDSIENDKTNFEADIINLEIALDKANTQLPKRGEWNNHEVACLLAEMFGDDCACNLNGIDEWLPQYCEFAETCCPNPVGVACWEQFLKHRAKMEVQE